MVKFFYSPRCHSERGRLKRPTRNPCLPARQVCPSIGEPEILHSAQDDRRRMSFYRLIVAMWLGVFVLSFGLVATQVGQARDGYPKLANYFLHWELTESDVQSLARWDVVVLDMENQVRNPGLLKKLRTLNPKIIILAYITSEEIAQNAVSSPSIMRRRLASRLSDNWYLTDPNGNRLTFWGGTHMLNVADNSPLVNGQRFTSALASFVSDEILSTGLWDGVFYDNTWDSLSWLTTNVDLDRDGAVDTNIDEHWRSGYRALFNETRRLTGDKYILVGNGGTKAYRNELNGILLENFPNTGGWSGTMDIYQFYEQGQRTPHVMIIDRNTLNSGKNNNYRSVRFGLASSMLGNGYYAFDYGDKDHGQLWWYDEYDAKVGDPISAPASLSGDKPFVSGVWRREFEHGVALVNGTDKAQEVDLGGEYEKIIGKQDPAVNDGSIVEKVKLEAYDGIVMYKTFQTIKNAVFTNGTFVRFYRADGSRARNGFFAFEDGFAGGAKIFNGDLDGDGQNEKVVASGAHLEIFNSRGEHWFNDYPFGANYKGELQLSVARLVPGEPMSIVVSGTTGGAVSVYNYHGGVIKDKMYPLGKKYTGGFSVATQEVFGAESNIVLGTGRGRAADILVYNASLTKLKKRISFDPRLVTGLSVAAGDFSGSGKPEIIAVARSSRSPVVRRFTIDGRSIGKFTLKGIFGTNALSLGAGDGTGITPREIMVMSAN